jgi:hypothetical protein
MKIYGLPDPFIKLPDGGIHTRIQYYCVPRQELEDYYNRHHLFRGGDRPWPPFNPVEVDGECLGQYSFDRALFLGDFPRDTRDAARRSTYVVASTKLVGPTPDLCYENKAVPEMGPGKKLIKALLGSDSGETEIPFGVLAKIQGYEESPAVSLGPSPSGGPYRGRAIDRLTLTLEDGSRQVAYVLSVGYFEGYQYDIFGSMGSALKEYKDHLRAIAVNERTALECWECGAIYEEPGHVEPGQMGCRRCR